MEIIYIMELIIGLVVGFLLGIIGNMIVIYAQFGRSIAGHRVSQAVEATKEFLNNPSNTGAARSKYYFSLGVLIDDLRNIDSNGTKSTTGQWPLIVDSTTDTHARFDRYIRPLLNDINSYSFLGGFRWRKDLRQLNALSKLCSEFEKVVSALDAGLENPAVVAIKENGITLISNTDDPRAKAVSDAYKKLASVWKHWTDCCT